jgi:hypothetical protein
MLAHVHDAEDHYGRRSDQRLVRRSSLNGIGAVSLLELSSGRRDPFCRPDTEMTRTSVARFNHASANANQRAWTSGETDCFAMARHAA